MHKHYVSSSVTFVKVVDRQIHTCFISLAIQIPIAAAPTFSQNPTICMIAWTQTRRRFVMTRGMMPPRGNMRSQTTDMVVAWAMRT